MKTFDITLLCAIKPDEVRRVFLRELPKALWMSRVRT